MGGIMADLARAEDILSIEAMSEKGRPRRAAAPTTFGEKEAESKASLLGQSPAKKLGQNGKSDTNGDGGSEKSGKRQKRTGEKPGRKAKGAQPLAALAAAPQGSPAKQFMQREDQTRAQKLEDASLLAGLQAGHHGMVNADGQMVFAQDRFLHPLGGSEEPDRSKTSGQAPVAKQSASSYWSVPEQNDFVKYIGYFGRDFAAIAAHMGTKTQTMIKNHYQRQIEGGNKPELERAATEAEDRRARGEDVGPPPTPTPIQKRKYESVPSSTQRPLAPHADAMDVDEPGISSRVQVPKHASPPQYQPQPRITSSSQNTPIPAPRVAPSPHLTTAAPAQPQSQTSAHVRSIQHPLGSRLTFMPDARPESRQAAQPSFGLRAAEDTAQRSLSQQNNRSPADARDPHFLSGLFQEQQRAIRLQEQQTQPERVEQLQRQPSMLRNPSQASTFSQPLQQQLDRKPIAEERAPTPPRSGFVSSVFPRSSLGSSNYALGPTPFTTLAGRSAFNYSPPNLPKREETRPPPLSSLPPAATPPTSAVPPEPKRSNVLSLLNDDEPQPPKRESLPSMPQRTSSPAPQFHAQGTSSAPNSAVPGMRREPSFGQPSMPQSQFGRSQFGQQSSTPATGPPTPKHEHGLGSATLSQTPKSDWTSRILGHSEPQRPPNPTLEREVRPYFQHNHRSLLGSLGQPRSNPSPPPLGNITHSRTPSLNTLPGQPAREQPPPGILGQQQSAQPLQPNPYASQSLPSFSQPPTTQAQHQNHHAHNVSIGGPLSGSHHRAMSRDEQYRYEQREREREREDREARWRQQELREPERRREGERYMRQEQERQQALHRQPPQPLHPPPFGPPPFTASRSLDLRKQSQIESELAMREEQNRQEFERRRHELMQRERDEDFRRRAQDEQMYHHRTPTGGGGFPPPPPGQRR
jgi:hypothetical protein